ncbi:hypothetical protein QBC43DRAFT_69263 [Cladorrhinum sp. PSN259]|nr:hypothetical protein QBC43DRAFT_69263 [Cladorrhinum sp. PSN259]
MSVGECSSMRVCIILVLIVVAVPIMNKSVLLNPGNPRRWWLPGPPPPRRLVSLKAVEESYRRDGTRELAIPVRSITVTSRETYISALAPYISSINSAISGAKASESAEPIYLFHGCGNFITDEVAHSFSRWGPSIRFSRTGSYFSAGPAVYWSTSVEFAVAWSFFAETGTWDMDVFNRSTPQQPFQCLVFVSKVSLETMNSGEGLYLIPNPQTPLEEEELEEWCKGNTNPKRMGKPSSLAPPPKSQRKNWGVIGSRIPRSTMHAFRTVYEVTEKIWLFAACNETSSRAIAMAGVEILKITFNPAAKTRSHI